MFSIQGMASFLWDASFFKKMSFKTMINFLNTKMFIKTSINDCLWNLTDPLVQNANMLIPSLVPEKNMGILYQVNNLSIFYINYYYDSFIKKYKIIKYDLFKLSK
jgi:hypothetical protein